MKTIYNNDSFEVYTDNDIKSMILEWNDVPENEITETDILQEREFLGETDFKCTCDDLNKETGKILCIASLGLWNGRKSGYKLLGSNLKEILYCAIGDYYKLEYDGFNVVATDSHHDGTNYYTFRELKEDTNYDILLDKLYSGTATKSDINRYTRSLRRYVKKIYGW